MSKQGLLTITCSKQRVLSRQISTTCPTYFTSTVTEWICETLVSHHHLPRKAEPTPWGFLVPWIQLEQEVQSGFDEEAHGKKWFSTHTNSPQSLRKEKGLKPLTFWHMISSALRKLPPGLLLMLRSEKENPPLVLQHLHLGMDFWALGKRKSFHCLKKKILFYYSDKGKSKGIPRNFHFNFQSLKYHLPTILFIKATQHFGDSHTKDQEAAEFLWCMPIFPLSFYPTPEMGPGPSPSFRRGWQKQCQHHLPQCVQMSCAESEERYSISCWNGWPPSTPEQGDFAQRNASAWYQQWLMGTLQSWALKALVFPWEGQIFARPGLILFCTNNPMCRKLSKSKRKSGRF